MKTITITHDQLFGNFDEPCESRYGYDRIYWNAEEGVHEYGSVQCHSSTIFGGTCQCNSHDTWEWNVISLDEVIRTLRTWGVVVEGTVNVPKIRRRIEDHLRKAPNHEVLRIAGACGVKLETE